VRSETVPTERRQLRPPWEPRWELEQALLGAPEMIETEVGALEDPGSDDEDEGKPKGGWVVRSMGLKQDAKAKGEAAAAVLAARKEARRAERRAVREGRKQTGTKAVGPSRGHGLSGLPSASSSMLRRRPRRGMPRGSLDVWVAMRRPGDSLQLPAWANDQAREGSAVPFEARFVAWTARQRRGDGSRVPIFATAELMVPGGAHAQLGLGALGRLFADGLEPSVAMKQQTQSHPGQIGTGEDRRNLELNYRFVLQFELEKEILEALEGVRSASASGGGGGGGGGAGEDDGEGGGATT